MAVHTTASPATLSILRRPRNANLVKATRLITWLHCSHEPRDFLVLVGARQPASPCCSPATGTVVAIASLKAMPISLLSANQITRLRGGGSDGMAIAVDASDTNQVALSNNRVQDVRRRLWSRLSAGKTKRALSAFESARRPRQPSMPTSQPSHRWRCAGVRLLLHLLPAVAAHGNSSSTTSAHRNVTNNTIRAVRGGKGSTARLPLSRWRYHVAVHCRRTCGDLQQRLHLDRRGSGPRREQRSGAGVGVHVRWKHCRAEFINNVVTSHDTRDPSTAPAIAVG